MSEVERKLDEVIDELYYQRGLLQRVMRQLQEQHPHKPRLSELRIAFISPGGKMATPGPVTLTTAGQVKLAIVLGFDENGNLMPTGFKMPALSFSTDDKTGAVAKIVDNGDDTATVTAVANGTANLSVAGSSAEGLALSDSEGITVAIGTPPPPPPPPTPVLSSIKIAFVDPPAA
jgi:hypothetical protein